MTSSQIVVALNKYFRAKYKRQAIPTAWRQAVNNFISNAEVVMPIKLSAVTPDEIVGNFTQFNSFILSRK